MNDYINTISELKPYLKDLDHMDVKTIEGDVSMREFIASAISYQPAWVTFLYRVRWGFVRLLGMKQEGIPKSVNMKPEDVPMNKGEYATFFKVDVAVEDKVWLAGISEAHLTASLGVVMEPLENGVNRFYVLTLVRYNKWTGPVYFNVIRPFHHIVVNQMSKAGVA